MRVKLISSLNWEITNNKKINSTKQRKEELVKVMYTVTVQWNSAMKI